MGIYRTHRHAQLDGPGHYSTSKHIHIRVRVRVREFGDIRISGSRLHSGTLYVGVDSGFFRGRGIRACSRHLGMTSSWSSLNGATPTEAGNRKYPSTTQRSGVCGVYFLVWVRPRKRSRTSGGSKAIFLSHVRKRSQIKSCWPLGPERSKSST